MSPQSSSIFHLWIPRKALKAHNCGLKRRPTWRISFLERLRRKNFFRANLPRETLNFNKVVTHLWNQLTTLSIQRQEKKCLQKYSIVSNNCSFLDAEGVRSGGHTYSLQPLRPCRLSAQKDLEQKGKLHVEMTTKRLATFVVTSEILPSIKRKFLLKSNQKRQKALLRVLPEGMKWKTKANLLSWCGTCKAETLKRCEEQELEKRVKMQ